MVHSSTDQPPEPDLSNHQIGDYLIGRRLGRGGMAEVYLAEQKSLRRQVAFKVLRSSLAKDETFVRRFHHEAQAAASLVHAHIVQIYEIGCVDGVHFIAQEYVDGQNLKQLIVRRGKLDIRRAITTIRQVAAALHKAGQRGIIHRDIKPENMLLNSAGEVKVADFGLARIALDGNRVDLTQVGMTMGTPLYMSPEQVEGQPLDQRSDLYSFGVMCYEMLAGRPPFEGDNAFSVAVQHLKNDPPRLESLREDMPGGLGRIVHKLLAKKREDRYQSAAEVLRDLRMLSVEGLEEFPVGDEDWTTPEWEAMASSRIAATQKLATVMAREAGLTRKRRWYGLLLGLVLAFVAGSGAAWMVRPKYLLNVSEGELERTPRQANAQAQFDYARGTAKERDFQAVAEYFPSHLDPKNAEFVRKAQLQLAYMYFENNWLNEAAEIVEELAAQEVDVSVQIRALTLQANILARRPGKEQEAISRLVVLVNVMDKANRTRQLRYSVWNELEKQRLKQEFTNLLTERDEGLEANGS
jgi:tRNA A-37 threonylcarbamoyl transferase component Bud32